MTLTDTSNKIKRGTEGDATALGPSIMAAVPAILDRVRDGVRKKVLSLRVMFCTHTIIQQIWTVNLRILVCSTLLFLTVQVDAKGGLAKKLFSVAYSRRLSAVNGSWFGAWGIEKHLWDFLVFRKVKAVLGGRIRFLLSGGAPLSADTQRFINICLG